MFKWAPHVKNLLTKYVSVMQANNRYVIVRTLDLLSIMDIRVWEPETSSERILFVCILFYHVIEFEWAVTWRHHALTVTTVTMQTVTESCPLSITPLDRALRATFLLARQRFPLTFVGTFQSFPAKWKVNDIIWRMLCNGAVCLMKDES